MRPLITGLVSHTKLKRLNTANDRKRSLNSPLHQCRNVIVFRICGRKRDRGRVLNFKDVAEVVHPLTGSAAQKTEDLGAHLITYHTLTCSTYQLKLNGSHSTHIPEQISERKEANLTRRFEWEART